MHTVEALQKFAPGADPRLLQAVADGNEAAKAAGINTPLRAQHFLAQIAHETGGFRSIAENMNYTAKRMMEVFGERKAKTGRIIRRARNGLTLAKAKQLDAAGAEAIANFLYGGEWGRDTLGNTEEGDGWRFRGSGFLQETGRENFERRAKETGLPLVEQPDILRQPDTAFAAACASWAARGCNQAADRDDVEEVTRRINPGMQGLEDRKLWLSKARKVLQAMEPPGEIVASEPANGWVPFGHYKDEGIRWVQRRLGVDLGYKSVGTADGTWGPKTIGALAEFRALNGIPDVQADVYHPRIDRRTYDALKSLDARPWVPSEARANVTTAELVKARPKTMVPAVATRAAGKIASGAAVVGTAAVGAADQLGPAWTMLSALKNFITSPWTLGALVVLLAVLLYVFGKGMVDRQKEAFVDGEMN